jgi:hypothetical protein
VILALVAMATAWSGYQATQWGGRQATLYGQASTRRFAADASSTRGGQILIADATFFTAWLQARSAGDAALEADLVQRFSPEYWTVPARHDRARNGEQVRPRHRAVRLRPVPRRAGAAVHRATGQDPAIAVALTLLTFTLFTIVTLPRA